MLNQSVLKAHNNQEILGASFSGDMHLADNLQVFYNASTGILHVKWQGEVGTRDFREGYTQILKLVRIYKPLKWILDLQNRESIRKEDQRWVVKHIFPQILRILNQDVFIAVILPVYLYESLIHDLSGDEFIDKENLLIMNHFLYYEESLRWLQEVNVASERA